MFSNCIFSTSDHIYFKILEELSFAFFTQECLSALNGIVVFQNPLSLLAIVESPSNLFISMELFEEFPNLCPLNQMRYHIQIRFHRTLAETWCLTKRNYEKLLKYGTIGNFSCDANGYKDPNGCRWIFNKKYLHSGNDFFGIDCVSYETGENQAKTMISQATVDASPVSPASYDYVNRGLFPLKSILFVGNYVLVPNDSIELMKRAYGN